MSQLFEKISYFMSHIHGFLFPVVAEELGELTVKQQQLIKILEMVRVEEYVSGILKFDGRLITKYDGKSPPGIEHVTSHCRPRRRKVSSMLNA